MYNEGLKRTRDKECIRLVKDTHGWMYNLLHLVVLRDNVFDDILVQPGPALVTPKEPESRYEQQKCPKNRPSIVHIESRHWQTPGKW